MIISGDIKVKNNLNPKIQGIGSYSDSKVFSFERETNILNKINVFPKNLNRYMSKDYSFDGESKDYINFLPKIKIKEFLPEIPEDQWLNVFGSAFTEMSATIEMWKNSKESFTQSMTKLKEQTINGELLKTIVENLKSRTSSTDGIPFDMSDIQGSQLYWFPEFLYRRLMSYQVTNWYVLPYSGTVQMGSRGQNGWQQRNLGFIGEVARFMKSVNVTGRPLWRLNGIDTDNIEFELILFNDTFENASQNFRFVHTIIPNNMWFQYGVFQHNPSLYDIQFDGGLRYFCCSLDVNCEAVGNLRVAPEGFIASVVQRNLESEKKVREINEKYQKFLNQETQIQEEINGLNNDKNLKERELGRIDQEMNKFVSYYEEESEMIDDLKNEKDEIQEEIKQLKSKIQSLEEKMNEISKKIEETEWEYASVELTEDIEASGRFSSEGYLNYFKIPDIYKMTFRFKSLLPTNFNTYLMTFNEVPIFEEKFEDNNGHFTTVYDDFVKVAADTIKGILQVENQGGESEQGPEEDSDA